MNAIEYAKTLFSSGSLEDKLLDPAVVNNLEGKCEDNILESLEPSRNDKIIFSSKQLKFPKKKTFHLDERRALALHFFANHELLAIEMMAAAILYLPVEDEYSKRIRSGLLATIKDEQKHFKMYVARMNELGCDFGDHPVNDYFWRQMQKVKTYDQYFAVMALTFEAANLDFAKNYSSLFKEVEDHKTSQILDIVYQDEISHVALGAHWLNTWKNDKTLWQYYKDCLPELLTPARSKGMIFDREGRYAAGLGDDFINTVENYQDEFNVTHRRQWNDSKS